LWYFLNTSKVTSCCLLIYCIRFNKFDCMISSAMSFTTKNIGYHICGIFGWPVLNKVSLIQISSYSNTWTVNQDSYWTSRESLYETDHLSSTLSKYNQDSYQTWKKVGSRDPVSWETFALARRLWEMFNFSPILYCTLWKNVKVHMTWNFLFS
jgi:hypothetical protein